MKTTEKIEKVYAKFGLISEVQKIVDNYAIDFLNWYISKSSIMDNKYIGKTSEELLEMFKKGL